MKSALFFSLIVLLSSVVKSSSEKKNNSLDAVIHSILKINETPALAITIGFTSGALSEMLKFSSSRCLEYSDDTLNQAVDLMFEAEKVSKHKKLTTMDYIRLGELIIEIGDSAVISFEECEYEMAAGKSPAEIIQKKNNLEAVQFDDLLEILANIQSIMQLQDVYFETILAEKEIQKHNYLAGSLNFGRVLVNSTYETLVVYNTLAELLELPEV